MDTIEKAQVTVVPTGAALGADIIGGDLSEPIADAVFSRIEAAWHEHLVLRFRDQHLDDPALLAFGRRFGEVDKAPVHATGDADHDPFPEVTVMSNIKVGGKPIGNLGHYEAKWHTDMSYNQRCPLGSLLYSLEVPPAGGDTGSCSMYLAYETLPAILKRAIAGKQCLGRGTAARRKRGPA